MLDAFSSEEEAIKMSIRSALLQYWNLFPHIYMMSENRRGQDNTQFSYTSDYILDEAFEEDQGNSKQIVEYPVASATGTSYGDMDGDDDAANLIPENSDQYLPIRRKTVRVSIKNDPDSDTVDLVLTDKGSGSGFLLPSKDSDLWVDDASVAGIDYNTGNLYMRGLEAASIHEDASVTVSFVEKNDRKRQATVLGPHRTDDSVASPHIFSDSIANVFSSIGFRRRNLRFGQWHGRAVNSERDLLYATEEDHIHGEIDFNYDTAGDRWNFIAPLDHYTLTVWWGIAFFTNTKLDLIRPSHYNIFSKLVLVEFLDSIIKSRSLVEFSGDATLNVGSLEQQLSELKEELREELPLLTLPTMLYG